MRDPPDKTTVKAPRSLANFSDKSAVYLAREVARSSSASKTSTAFFFSLSLDTDVVIEALALRLPTILKPLVVIGEVVLEQSESTRGEL